MGFTAQLWADGSGTSKGPIGWAYVLLALDSETGEVVKRMDGAGSFPEGTNNRAELMAVITGLLVLTRPTDVVVFSDSEYVCNPFAKGYLDSWRRNDWRTSTRPAKTAEAGCGTCGATGSHGDVCERHTPAAVITRAWDPKSVRNRDLWTQLDMLSRRHRLLFEHVKGHAGVELNEDCDRRAGEARRGLINELGVAQEVMAGV